MNLPGRARDDKKPRKNSPEAKKKAACQPTYSTKTPAMIDDMAPKKALLPHMSPMNVPSRPLPAATSMAAAWVRELTENRNTPNNSTEMVIPIPSPLRAMVTGKMTAAAMINTIMGFLPMRSDKAPNIGPANIPGAASRATWNPTQKLLMPNWSDR